MLDCMSDRSVRSRELRIPEYKLDNDIDARLFHSKVDYK